MGADVNSMTLAPEVILASELLIPCSGLVVGHKYSENSAENNKKIIINVIVIQFDGSNN